MSAAERPLRKDAERNRHRILQSAREVFAERGLGASLDDIARHADVGVGTVYRHFRDKERLIDALFEARLTEVAQVLEDGLAEPDPWTGLAGSLERVLELQAADCGLMELLFSDSEGGDSIACGRDRLGPLTEQLLRRAQADGSVRADVEPSDVPLMQMMLGTMIDATRDADPELWRRFFTLSLEALRADGRENLPLPVAGLDAAQLEVAMRGWRRSRRTRARREPA